MIVEYLRSYLLKSIQSYAAIKYYIDECVFKVVVKIVFVNICGQSKMMHKNRKSLMLSLRPDGLTVPVMRLLIPVTSLQSVNRQKIERDHRKK